MTVAFHPQAIYILNLKFAEMLPASRQLQYETSHFWGGKRGAIDFLK